MRASLQQRVDLQLANEASFRDADRWDFDEMSKLAALICTSRDHEIDAQRYREVKRILKQNAGIFSNWRGLMQVVVVTKMTLADDPQAYFEGVNAAYRKLTEGKILREEEHALCAMTLYEACTPERLDGAIAQTLAQYRAARQAHPVITSSSDLTMLALMVLAGYDVEEASTNAEECNELLKPFLKMFPDTRQMTSHVLVLSDKPSQEKVDKFWSLYQALKAAKHAMSRSMAISILAAYVDLDIPESQLVSEISEVDEYLKSRKGYGNVFGVGSSFRRLMAAVLVLQDHLAKEGMHIVNATSTAIVEAIAEQIVSTIILLVVITTINVSNSSHN